MTDKDVEGLAGCATAIFMVVFWTGLYALAAWAAQYIAASFFAKHLPFWPLFVGIWLLRFVINAARPGVPIQKEER